MNIEASSIPASPVSQPDIRVPGPCAVAAPLLGTDDLSGRSSCVHVQVRRTCSLFDHMLIMMTESHASLAVIRMAASVTVARRPGLGPELGTSESVNGTGD